MQTENAVRVMNCNSAGAEKDSYANLVIICRVGSTPQLISIPSCDGPSSASGSCTIDMVDPTRQSTLPFDADVSSSQLTLDVVANSNTGDVAVIKNENAGLQDHVQDHTIAR